MASPSPTYPSIPDTQSIPMTTRQDMIVLSIPFDLCSGVSPIRQSHYGAVIILDPDVPPLDRSVDRGGSHKVRIPSVPIDISDPSLVRFDDPGETGRWRRGTQIPEEQLLS